jgi:6-pyruvoyltetrahydropterin/6-carboxytetrahydropterin synthase
MDIFRIFHLQCSRRLPALPESHPCSRLHGHSFKVEVSISGDIDPTLGWVLDFADIEAAWQPIHAALDHRCLNDIAGLENPTSENLAVAVGELKPRCPACRKSGDETHDSGCATASGRGANEGSAADGAPVKRPALPWQSREAWPLFTAGRSAAHAGVFQIS